MYLASHLCMCFYLCGIPHTALSLHLYATQRIFICIETESIAIPTQYVVMHA